MSVRAARKNGEPVSGVWLIDWRAPSGKREQRRFHGTLAEAEALHRALRQQTPNSSRNPRIRDIITDYLRWLESDRSPRTFADYHRAITAHILPVFGLLPVNHIAPQHIQQYKDRRKGKVRATNKELDILGSIVRWMVDSGHIDKGLNFRPKKLPYKRPLPKVPHGEDVEAFLAEIGTPLKLACVLTMGMCGSRYTETVHLRWQDIDWRRDEVRFVERVKRDRQRVMPLPPPVREILEPLAQKNGYIWENPQTGKPYGSMKTMFAGASRRAGVERITPHQLRHYFATRLLRGTGDLRLVQTALGHTDIRTTTIYAHVMQDALAEGIARAGLHQRNTGRAKTPKKTGRSKREN